MQPMTSIAVALLDFHKKSSRALEPGSEGEGLCDNRTHCADSAACTDNAIVHQGVLDEGTPFIQKPYAVSSLLTKVREVVEAPVE